jgi:hypothetical protein
MADSQISDDVWVKDGATGGEIARITSAIARVAASSGVDIDVLLTSRVDVEFLTKAQMKAHGDTLSDGSAAWGYYHANHSSGVRRIHIQSGLDNEDTEYTGLHELGHAVDDDMLNPSKRTTLMALMDPAAPTGPTPNKAWASGAYKWQPSEVFGDTFPRAYSDITERPYHYERKIPASSYSAYRTAVGAAGGPAATTLAAASAIGALVLKVVSVTGFTAGDWFKVGTGATAEKREIAVVGTAGAGGTGLQFTDPLDNAHSSGVALVEVAEDPPPSSGAIHPDPIVANTPNGGTLAYTFAGLPANATGVCKMRAFDSSEWGAWSDEVAVALAVTPGKPKILSVTPGTLTPDIVVQIVSSNSADVITHYIVRVVQPVGFSPGSPPQEVLKMFVESDVSGGTNSLAIPYSGNEGGDLAPDQQYYVTVQLAGLSGVLSPVSERYYFRPGVDTGPMITPNDPATKLNTKLPTFTLAHRTAANIVSARLYVHDSTETTLLYDSGPVPVSPAAASKNLQVPTGKLENGMDIKVSGTVQLSGETNHGPRSVPFPMHINFSPGAPAPLSAKSTTDQVVRRFDGVWVSNSARPTLVFPFRDLDRDLGYVDAPTRREIELRSLADAHVGASPYVITSGITDEWTIPAAVLVAETTYKSRARYDDNANFRSAFSDYMYIRYSAGPTLSSVTPANGATITDPTPLVDWIFASAGGKAQGIYRIVARQGADELYNSGPLNDGESSHPIPAGLLPDAATVTITLTVEDSDGLYASASHTVTTAFTAPDAVTGLTLTPDTDEKSVLIEWDATALPDGELYYFGVDVREPGGQFRRVATLYDEDATSFLFRGAVHNAETVVRVVQSNGFAESEPAEETVTLGGTDVSDPAYIHDYWLMTDDTLTQLPSARSELRGRTQHNAGDTKVDLETFQPIGRGEKVLVTWGSTGYEGSLDLLTTDRELVRLLRRYKDQGTVAILKLPYGESRYVRLTSVTDDDQPGGWIQCGVTYIQVAASSVNF